MVTIATIRAALLADTVSFQASMKQAATVANQTLGQIQQSSTAASQSIQMLSKTAAGFIGFDAIKTGVQTLLDAQKAVQQIHYTLLSATGSSAVASQAYGQVAAIADRLGLSLQGAELGFAQMSAAAGANGVSLKDQLALFDGLARSATVLHLSSDQTSSAILALSQMFAKGKIQAQELQLQLGQAIPGVVPRFQNAVMAMTKGTELAGKSFEQLMQAGDLSVTRFMPALVQALSQTGQGAEQAATGLNASMNRLSTAWFKLKSDLSGGLFSDAATASISLMAANLDHIASSAAVVGAIALSRFAGQGVQKAVGAGSDYLGQQQAARASATAQREEAESIAATSAQASLRAEAAALENQVMKDSAAAALDDAKAREIEAFGIKEVALAEMQRLESAAALNEALGTGAAAKRLSAQLDAQIEVVSKTLLVAEKQMTAALVEQAAARDALMRAETQQAGLGAVSAGLGVKASEAAATVEAARAAEAEALSLSSAVRKVAASFGSFALGLVGGPWGAAIAAIGGVGYAVYALQKQSEEWRQETENQVKSLQELRTQVLSAAKDYGTLHAAMGLGQSIDLYQQSTDDLKKKRDELADLQKQASVLQGSMDSRAANPNEGTSILDWFDQRKLEQITDRIKDLQQQIPPTTQDVDALSTKIAGSMVPAVDAIKGAIDRLKAGASLGDIFSGLSTDIDAGIKGIDAARAKVQQIQSDMQTSAASLTKAAATDGMNNAQKQQYELRQAIAQIRAQHLAPDAEKSQIADVSSTAATAIQAGSQKDAADAAKKAATEAISKAKEWKQQADTLNNSLQQTGNELQAQLGQTSKLTPAQKQLQDILGGTSTAYNHASAALKAKMLAEAQDNAQLSLQVKNMQDAQRQAEALAVVQANIARISQQHSQQNTDTLVGLGLGTQAGQDAASLREIERQYDDLMRQAGTELVKGPDHGGIAQGTYDSEIASYKAALNKQLKDEQAFYAQRDAMQADWKVGAQRAMDDYEATTRDTASQTASAFSDAFSNMEDAELSLVTKGKINFSSFADSVISDFARMEIRAANSSILSYFTSWYTPITSASSGIASSVSADVSGYSNDLALANNLTPTTYVAGARANGGPTAGGSIYEVAENGKPEIYRQGSRSYLLSGSDGYVQPVTGGASVGGGAISGGGGVNVVVNNHHSGADVTATATKGADGTMNIEVMVKQLEKALTGRVNSGKSTLLPAMAQRMGTSTAGGLS